MNTFLPPWLDSYLRRHPVLMALSVMALAVVAFWVLATAGYCPLVYEGF
jgi:hypothetical protein